MNTTKKVQHLTELEAALRGDADMTRTQAGSSVRLNLDEAADAVAELRAIHVASLGAQS